MSTPALMRLREANPAAHIGMVTPAGLADLWRGHPAVDEVIPFTRAEGTGNLSRRLRQSGFHRAVILPNSFRSALECWMAGIPERIGFGGNGRAVLLTRVVPRRREEVRMHKRTVGEVRALVADKPQKNRDRFPQSGHQVYDYLHLVHSLGASLSPSSPKIAITDEEIAAFREKHGISRDLTVVGINPGAEYGPAKRWPADHFIQAASSVQARRPCAWLLTGGPGDIELARAIAAGIEKAMPAAHVYNTAGQTTLRELGAALALCQVVLTNDTGPMHLAAAVGTTVVVPFGSTSPELTGPGVPGDSRPHLVLGQAPCAPCFRRECPIDLRCLRSISPEIMAGEIREVLEALNSEKTAGH